MVTEEIVGPVDGPLSTIPEGSGSAAYMWTGVAYDIAIGGLPFMKAPSDERPYARETAQFRKEQIDQSSSVGDQSLTGYWTRGQLSFHRGAGLTYYEVTDGETILNRYTDSLGVDPWTPGAVTLRPATSVINAMAALDVVLHNGDLAVLKSDGTVQEVTYAGVATAKALTGGGTSTSITSDGVNVYAVNAAKIDRLTPGGAFATLWTHHVGGKTFVYVWWAKSRLWAIDSDGKLFTLSTVGGATAAGDILWTSPYTTATWSLAESEGAVYLAAKDTIWASTVDASTATPVLGGPVTVGRIAAQETIGTIGEYLGYLTVASSAGVRVAKIGDGLILGDLVVEIDSTNCSRMAFRKSLASVTGTASGSATKRYELDLLEQVSDLQPAYAPMRSLGTTTSKHGSFMLPDGRCGNFSSNGIVLEGASLGAATGTIRTGFHRFGTLEQKDFRSVSVYASGTGGTINVSLVHRDGTTSSIYTLGVSDFGDNELSLNLPAITDYIGLEFTITAVGGVAPTLLGYQLRALPAPLRQRLIQLPLILMDTERVGNTTHGWRGWAKQRLVELETMEESSGTVVYQDFNLDEQGVVLIEQIQFQNTTPHRPDGNGFGGFIMLTLRKVA